MAEPILENWTKGKVLDFLQLQRGYDITKAQAVAAGVPVVSSSGISYFHNEAKVDPPGVVTGRKGKLGDVYYFDVPFWPHDTSLWVRDFKGNDPHFVALFLSWLKLERLDAATSVPTLNRNVVHNQAAIFPPVSEQQKIAEILGTWDKAIDITEGLIEAMKKRKKGLMQRLLTGEVRFPDFRGNEVPQYSMFELTNEMYGGGTPSTKNEEYWQGDIPWITGSAIEDAKVANIEKHISEAAVTESSTRIVPRGSILLVTRTGVGKIAIAPCDIAISQDFTGVIADPSFITPEFLYYSLLGTIDQLQQLNQGTSINGVTREDLKKHRLLVPELNEQLKITEVLKACDLEIEFRLKLLEHLKIQNKGIMQRLLTGQVRVKVN